MKASTAVKIGLNAKELARIRKTSVATGIPMPRLLADLVRAGLEAREQTA